MSVIVGVGVVIERAGKVLLGKRASGAWKNFWSLPGGKVEEFESVEECARRELTEETGLIASGPISIISVSTEIDTARRLHCVTFGTALREFNGELSNLEPAKFYEWQWSRLDDLPEQLFKPTISVVRAYCAWTGLRLPTIKEAGLRNNSGEVHLMEAIE